MISREDFEKVEIRVGTIIDIEEFPEAKKQAWKLKVNFGEDCRVKTSSAQITDLYDRHDLLGRQVMAVVPFSLKQISPYMSECVVTGFADHGSFNVLVTPERVLPNGLTLE